MRYVATFTLGSNAQVWPEMHPAGCDSPPQSFDPTIAMISPVAGDMATNAALFASNTTLRSPMARTISSAFSWIFQLRVVYTFRPFSRRNSSPYVSSSSSIIYKTKCGALMVSPGSRNVKISACASVAWS